MQVKNFENSVKKCSHGNFALHRGDRLLKGMVTGMEKESIWVRIVFSFLLIMTAMIWGAAFVAQSVGADHVGAYTFLATRTWLAVIILIPVSVLYDKVCGNENLIQIFKNKDHTSRHELLIAGSVCGFFIFAGSAAQQIGIAYTTTARSSFITAMYVIFVPVLLMLTGHKTGLKTWIYVALSVAGLYLLCINGKQEIGFGDFITLLCALFFACQIISVGKYVRSIDGMKLTIAQFVMEAVLSTICMLLFEKPDMGEIIAAAPAIIYAGVLSSAVGYTLQVICQKHIRPSVASVIMCMESVFGALAGWLILGQSLTLREVAGCMIMFAAILLSQILG